jgi:hypothetical protein
MSATREAAQVPPFKPAAESQPVAMGIAKRQVWAVKHSPRSQRNVGYRPDSGPSRGDPCTCAFRPKRPYAKLSVSACASAISGISKVGAKPSSAREEGVRVCGPAGGLVKLGERESSPEFEASRPLLTRNRDGSLKRPFCGGRVGGVAL